MKGKYDDLLYLPHHISLTRPHMATADRAAQFSPFAALTGYEDAVRETARVTEGRIELDESEKALLNEKLRLLAEARGEAGRVAVTYFLPDQKKTGGAYVTAAGRVKKVDGFSRAILLEGGECIPIEDIAEIEGELFLCVP